MGGVLGRMKSASVDVSVNVAMRERRSGTPFPILRASAYKNDRLTDQLSRIIDLLHFTLSEVSRRNCQAQPPKSEPSPWFTEEVREALHAYRKARLKFSHLTVSPAARFLISIAQPHPDPNVLRNSTTCATSAESSREQSRRLSATGRLNLPLKSSPPTYGSSTTGTKAFAAMPFPPSQEGTAQPLSPTRIKWTHSSTPSFPLLLLQTPFSSHWTTPTRLTRRLPKEKLLQGSSLSDRFGTSPCEKSKKTSNRPHKPPPQVPLVYPYAPCGGHDTTYTSAMAHSRMARREQEYNTYEAFLVSIKNGKSSLESTTPASSTDVSIQRSEEVNVRHPTTPKCWHWPSPVAIC